jgi:hypothetical protein
MDRKKEMKKDRVKWLAQEPIFQESLKVDEMKRLLQAV